MTEGYMYRPLATVLPPPAPHDDLGLLARNTLVEPILDGENPKVLLHY